MSGFHAAQDLDHVINSAVAVSVTAAKPAFTYEFENCFHPFVGHLIKQLNSPESLAALFDANDHEALSQDPVNKQFFTNFYELLEKEAVKWQGKEIELGNGPYSNYNWELLFHFPFAIAVHLSKNQRFAEAQRWFHYIFDPTATDKRYWKFLRFRQIAEVSPIDEQLALLGKDEKDVTAPEKKLRDDLLKSYDQIKNKPFQPHPVAQLRVFPYQYAVVMRYLDNLDVLQRASGASGRLIW